MRRDPAQRPARRRAGSARPSRRSLAYLVGNEIPPDIVRWYGPERVAALPARARRRGRRRVDARRARRATRTSRRPSTSTTDFLDFVASTSTCTARTDFRRYLAPAAQHRGRPAARPDRVRHRLDPRRARTQAATLSWQVRAGVRDRAPPAPVVFSWTDDWFTGGHQIADWAFGLVDARAPAEAGVPRRAARSTRRRCRRRSRVPARSRSSICAYNAERTMDACLASLARCATRTTRSSSSTTARPTRTLAITERVRRRPAALHAHQPGEQGPVASRATSASRGATGEIVAYTDSDCVADPGLAALPRLQVSCAAASSRSAGRTSRRPRTALVAAVRRRRRRAGRRTCCSTTRSPSTSPAATWRSEARRCEEVGGFEPIFARRGRRRRPLLAAAEPRARDRLQPGGDGLALPAQHREGLPQAAARLRQGGGAALLQASVPLQPARPVALARPHLRRPHDARLARAGRSSTSARSGAASSRRCTSRRRRCFATCRSRSSGTPSAALLCLRRSLRGGPGVARPRCRSLISLGRAAIGAAHRRPRRPALRRLAGARAGRAAHLPRPARARLAALPLARARAHRRRAHRLPRRRAAAAHRLARARVLACATGASDGHEKEALLDGVMEFLCRASTSSRAIRAGADWDLEIYRGIWSQGAA